jgi:hypothetical protein
MQQYRQVVPVPAGALPDEDLVDILSRDIPWETYMTARMITDRDLQLIRRYDKKSEELQNSLLDEVGDADRARAGSQGPGIAAACRSCADQPGSGAPGPGTADRAPAPGAARHFRACRRLLLQNGTYYVEALVSVLRNVTKEETAQYVLALLVQMLDGALPGTDTAPADRPNAPPPHGRPSARAASAAGCCRPPHAPLTAQPLCRPLQQINPGPSCSTRRGRGTQSLTLCS